MLNKYLMITIILFSCFICQSKSKRSRPNVLFFLVDDMGWRDVGYQGSDFYETPNIDRLSDKGVVFSNAYASHPRCVPSRYAIMTGRYPARAQMPGPGEGKLKSNIIAGDDGKLNPTDRCIAKEFKSVGYKTFFTGKWHLATSGTFPEDVGFDINIAGGHAGSPISYFHPYNEGRATGKKAPIKGLEEGYDGEYLTDRITKETLKFLDDHLKNSDEPFFAFVSHYAVHEPLEAKRKDIERFQERQKKMHYEGPEFIPEGTGTTKVRQDDPKYAAMIYSMDQSLGRIINKLEEEKVMDNTIIVFFSDNGGLSNRGFRPRHVATSNLPLRAGKGHLYEGGIREPMIVYDPRINKSVNRSDAIVIGNDFYPTLMEMSGMSTKGLRGIDGQSFLWALKGQKNPNPQRSIFWHSPVPRPQSTGDESCTAVRKGDYKLIEWYDKGIVELYNITNDIGEESDLSKEDPDKVKELLTEVKVWRNEVDAYMGKKK
ncbi:sulfatase [Halosquirtibacter xylanolyticus]|uniref:sulfatase n=1 Tax=Halosquirtibacter xylanolyticus TaxID=3374599 RepID=UPI003747BBA7|nr:sulfatase [Prolixibacteraceae bacterium]